MLLEVEFKSFFATGIRILVTESTWVILDVADASELV